MNCPLTKGYNGDRSMNGHRKVSQNLKQKSYLRPGIQGQAAQVNFSVLYVVFYLHQLKKKKKQARKKVTFKFYVATCFRQKDRV